MTWLAVVAGGAAGSLARHAVNVLYTRTMGQAMPFATATVNIIGCAVIGSLAGLLASGGLRMQPEARAFWFVGVLGGFTTFSSMALDTLTLVQGGERGRAAVNVLVQVVFGVGAAFLGYAATSSR